MRKCFQEKPVKQGLFKKHFLAVVHPMQWAVGGGQHLSPICQLWRWSRRVGNLHRSGVATMDLDRSIGRLSGKLNCQGTTRGRQAAGSRPHDRAGIQSSDLEDSGGLGLISRKNCRPLAVGGERDGGGGFSCRDIAIAIAFHSILLTLSRTGCATYPAVAARCSESSCRNASCCSLTSSSQSSYHLIMPE